MTLDLFVAPIEVANKELWLEGLGGTPEVGDLWLLSWNREALGLIALTAVTETYVLGWPVTLSGRDVFAPAIELASPLDSQIAIWPTRETGVGLHLLHRRFGEILDAKQVWQIREALDNDNDPPIRFAPPSPDLQISVIQGEQMADEWQSICFHQWPEAHLGISPLNRRALLEHQVRPSDLAWILGIDDVSAGAIHRGTRTPTRGQVELLAEHLGVASESLVTSQLEEAVTLLLQPIWKDKILDAGQKRSLDEAQARRGIELEYGLAARSNGSQKDRMEAAIDRFSGL